MKKKLTIILACILVTASFLTACAATSPAKSTTNSTVSTSSESSLVAPSDKPIKVGMTIAALSNPTWVAMVEAMKVEAKKQNIDFTVSDANNDQAAQISAIENFITNKCDAIIVNAWDPKASLPVVQKAMNAGIKVICYDQKLDQYDAFVGVDNKQIGTIIGQQAAQFITQKLNGMAVVGVFSFDSVPLLKTRSDAIKAEIEKGAPGSTIIDIVAGDSASVNMQNAENALTAHPDMKIIAATADFFGLAAYEAASASKKGTADFGIFSCDATPDALKHIKEGGIYRMSLNLDVLSFGPAMIDMAYKAVNGVAIEKEYTNIPMKPVTIDNVDQFLNATSASDSPSASSDK